MERLVTSFQAYKLTADELQAARTLTTEQRAYYQTLLSDAAEEKLGIMLDPYKPLEFTQREAYLRGQIDILNMILDTSDSKITRPANAVPGVPNPNKS